MKKKVFSLILVLFLVCTMVIPVSAASFYTMGSYGSSTYEISDTCNLYSFTSYTYCDDHSYYLKSDVSTYALGYVTDEEGVTHQAEIMMQKTYGNSDRVASVTSGETGFLISKIKCEHYVNGSYVYSDTVRAG